MAATSNGSLPKLRVGIIGGGPAGLATLKYLLMAPQHFPDMPAIDVRLFEMEPTIGGTLRYRVYEQAEMVSSRYLTSFSDFRFPAETQDFPTPTQYAAYLDAYAEQWGLMPHVECGKRVVSLQRLPGSKGGRGKHRMLVETVASGNRESWDCDAVAICVGVNSVPTKTTIPGVEIGMPGKIKVLHSSQFKGRDDFGPDQGAGKTVVVVGAGETGSDIAHLAITSKAKEVILCHRHGFTFAPKITPWPVVLRFWGKPDPERPMKPNKPLDCAIASLLDTAYLHPRLQHSFLPWWAYDCFVKGMFWLISGTTTGIDQWAGRVEDDFCVDSLFFVKSNRVIPYISAPHRPRSLGERIRSFLINIPVPEIPKDRIVKVATWPTKLDKDGILHFAPTDRPEKRLLNSEGPDGRGSWAKPDVIIMANGYQQTFPFLPTDGSYKTAREVDTHGIYDSTDVSLGYIGIVRPSVGAIPPLAEMQTLVWTHRLLRSWYPSLVPPVPSKSTRDVIAPYKLSYRLRPRAMRDMAYLKYGVDHESYAYQLALEAGAAPTIWWVLRNGWFKLAYVWAFGPNFNPKHRLVGPWKWAGMPKSAAAARPNKAGMIVNPEEVMKGELWNVVKRSGGFVFIFWYTIVPFIFFAFLNLLYYIYDGVAAIANGVRRLFVATPVDNPKGGTTAPKQTTEADE